MFVGSKRGRREVCVVKMHSQLLPWICIVVSASIVGEVSRREIFETGRSSQGQSDVPVYARYDGCN